MYDKLTPPQIFELESKKMTAQVGIFSGLLAVVAVLNLAPLVIGLVSRPADNSIQGIKESSLLLTGALTSAAGFFLTGRGMSGQQSTTHTETIERAIKPKEENDDEQKEEGKATS